MPNVMRCVSVSACDSDGICLRQLTLLLLSCQCHCLGVQNVSYYTLKNYSVMNSNCFVVTQSDTVTSIQQSVRHSVSDRLLQFTLFANIKDDDGKIYTKYTYTQSIQVRLVPLQAVYRTSYDRRRSRVQHTTLTCQYFELLLAD